MARGLSSRRLALEILGEVAAGSRPEELLAAGLTGLGRAEDRHLVSHLVYGTLRWQGRLDFIIDHFARRGAPDEVRRIFRLGLYQIIYLDRVPDHAAVDTSVRLAKSRSRGLASLVNGVLRNYLRQRDKVPWPQPGRDPARFLAIDQSLPMWLASSLVERFGLDEATELARASNRIPPLTLRTNTRVSGRDELMAELAGPAGEVRPGEYCPEAVMVSGIDGALEDFGAFRAGRFTVQDEAAQLVSHLAGVQPGQVVVDLCAGRGGKTFHLAALMENRGRILAWDVSHRRINELTAEAERLGFDIVSPMVLDATSDEAPPFSADVVVVDAPCTGLGVIRRRPDIKWRLRPEDAPRLAELQGRLLDRAAGLVGPGGRLVYAVCTFTEAECEGAVDKFLARHGDFRLESAHGRLPDSADSMVDRRGFFRVWPHVHGIDGFFGAVLLRT